MRPWATDIPRYRGPTAELLRWSSWTTDDGRRNKARVLIGNDAKALDVIVHLVFSVEADGDASQLNLRVDLKGCAFFDPLGSASARTAKGDIDQSLARFVERFAS